MSKRFDVCTPRPKYGEEGKSWWHRVGSAHQSDKGQITIYLDSVPVPDPARENKIVMMLFEPRDKDDAKGAQRTTRGGKKENIDDEIPF